MLRRSFKSLGYDKWPWPAKLPLKPSGWYRKFDTRTQSLSQDVKRVQSVGDLAVILFLLTFVLKAVFNYNTGAYQTRLKHLTGAPPAIIANEFDFENPEANRCVSRAQLDKYRSEFTAVKSAGGSIESFIFNY